MSQLIQLSKASIQLLLKELREQYDFKDDEVYYYRPLDALLGDAPQTILILGYGVKEETDDEIVFRFKKKATL